MRPDLICCETCAYLKVSAAGSYYNRCTRTGEYINTYRSAPDGRCDESFSGWIPADPKVTTGVGGRVTQMATALSYQSLVARVTALEAEVAELKAQVPVKPAPSRHFDFTQSAT